MLTLIQIWIQLFTVMGILADPDPQPWPLQLLILFSLLWDFMMNGAVLCLQAGATAAAAAAAATAAGAAGEQQQLCVLHAWPAGTGPSILQVWIIGRETSHYFLRAGFLPSTSD
jgi:hypothetical protein